MAGSSTAYFLNLECWPNSKLDTDTVEGFRAEAGYGWMVRGTRTERFTRHVETL